MSNFSTFFELHFSCLKSILFFPEYQKMLLSGFFFGQKKNMRKSSIFSQNHGLTPLQNVDFLEFVELFFLWPKKHSFLSRISKNVSFCPSLLKKQDMKKRSIFRQKPWSNPVSKCQFFLLFLNFTFHV